MEPAHLSLLAASIAFVGLHFLLSHPLRAPLVGSLGERGFLGVYSVVALLTLAWMVVAFRAAPAPNLSGTGEAGWIVTSLLTVVALVLFMGSLFGNPAFPDPKHAAPIPAEPRGVFAVTRHPMMWGFAIWALSHLILYWSVRTMIVAIAIAVLALVGARLQDRKKEALLGESWKHWEARTSYWPRFHRLFSVGLGLWLKALVVWLVACVVHLITAGIPAGFLRWIGI